MGELSGGRSATSPTFFRSTSVRTRMEWQNSHVVCTALDQRNVIGAPQFGQLETGALMADRIVQCGGYALGLRRTPLATRLRNQRRAGAGSKTDSGTVNHILETCDRPGGTPRASTGR